MVIYVDGDLRGWRSAYFKRLPERRKSQCILRDYFDVYEPLSMIHFFVGKGISKGDF